MKQASVSSYPTLVTVPFPFSLQNKASINTVCIATFMSFLYTFLWYSEQIIFPNTPKMILVKDTDDHHIAMSKGQFLCFICM